MAALAGEGDQPAHQQPRGDRQGDGDGNAAKLGSCIDISYTHQRRKASEQAELLRAEGIAVDAAGCLPLARHRWQPR